MNTTLPPVGSVWKNPKNGREAKIYEAYVHEPSGSSVVRFRYVKTGRRTTALLEEFHKLFPELMP